MDNKSLIVAERTYTIIYDAKQAIYKDWLLTFWMSEEIGTKYKRVAWETTSPGAGTDQRHNGDNVNELAIVNRKFWVRFVYVPVLSSFVNDHNFDLNLTFF